LLPETTLKVVNSSIFLAPNSDDRHKNKK